MHSIEKVNFKDSVEIKKLLMNSKSIAVSKGKLLQEILMHIDKEGCVANKIDKDGVIFGVWLSKEYDTHISLSYFFIRPEVRLQRIVLDLFMKSVIQCNKGKPLLVQTKDSTGFDKYFELIDNENDIYRFKGFR